MENERQKRGDRADRKPQDEFVEKLGYSDDWATYPLCEFAYSQFKLFGCSPVIFCNLLDPDAAWHSPL